MALSSGDLLWKGILPNYLGQTLWRLILGSLIGLALRTLGASRLRIVREVLVPGAMPSIATGARLSIGYAWRAAIAGEMLAGRRGLGWMIFSAQQVDQTTQVILGMVLIGCLWILLDRYVLRPIESDTIQRWGLVQR